MFEAPTLIEWVGYAASLLIAASLMMNNITRLRWTNLVGAAVFSAYGAAVHAWPVFAVNGFIACVDVYYLALTRRKKDFFELLPVQSADPFLHRFVEFHAADIARFYPGFSPGAVESCEGSFILRNMLPVGLVLFEPRSNGELEVRLDYVIPEYRDMKNAEFAYRRLGEQFRARGVRALVVRNPSDAHAGYLRRVGYVETQSGVLRKSIVDSR